MKNYFAMLLLSTLSVVPAFAGGDLGEGEPSTTNYETTVMAENGDFASRNADIIAATKGSKKYAENLALINQINANGHETRAYIDQSGGAGNVAAIIQDGRVNSASAAIFQVGSGNRAIVHQH